MKYSVLHALCIFISIFFVLDLEAQKSGIKWGELGKSKYTREVFLGTDSKRNFVFASVFQPPTYQIKQTIHEVAIEVYSPKQELIASLPVVLEFPELSGEKLSSDFGEKIFIELDSQVVLIGQAQYKRKIFFYHCSVDINKREVSPPKVFFKSELESGFDMWSKIIISGSKKRFAYAAKRGGSGEDNFEFFVFDNNFNEVKQSSLNVLKEFTCSLGEKIALSDVGGIYFVANRTVNLTNDSPMRQGQKSELFYIKHGETVKQRSFDQDKGLLINVRLWSGSNGSVYLTGYQEQLSEDGFNELVFMVLNEGAIKHKSKYKVKDIRENMVYPVYLDKSNFNEVKESYTQFPNGLPVKFMRQITANQYLLVAEESITYNADETPRQTFFAGDLYCMFTDANLNVIQQFVINRSIQSSNYLGVSDEYNFQVITDGLNGGILFESIFYGKDAKKSEYDANTVHTELLKWENMVAGKRRVLESLKDRDRRPIYWAHLSSIVPIKSFFCFGHQGFGAIKKKNLGKVAY